MKYDRGRRASKELSFCGIDKFILLPRFVGGWSNFDRRLPMFPRVSIPVSSISYHFLKYSFQIYVRYRKSGYKYFTRLFFFSNNFAKKYMHSVQAQPRNQSFILLIIICIILSRHKRGSFERKFCFFIID